MRDDPYVVALVARAADGDEGAWDEIVDRYAPLVWSICARYRLSAVDIEDVGQTIWAGLVTQLGKLREPAALPGWLVLIPRRHGTSIAALTDAEAAALGTWQVRLSRALQQVTGCEKTYVAQFAEAEGFSHVHFHIIPRPAGLGRDLRGPRIFRLLGAAGHERVSDEQMDEIAIALANRLGG